MQIASTCPLNPRLTSRERCADARELGSPNMNQWPGKYGRSSATFKDALNSSDEREGLWGSHLPIITFQHTITGPPPNGPGATCGHCSGHCHNTSVEPSGGCKYPCATGSNGQCCVPCHAATTCKSPCKPCQHHPQRCCCPGGNKDDASTASMEQHDWIEFVAVPVADMQGSPEQDVFVSFTWTSVGTDRLLHLLTSTRLCVSVPYKQDCCEWNRHRKTLLGYLCFPWH